MKFINTSIQGVWIIELDLKKDERGHFARTWCEQEMSKYGLTTRVVQCNTSFNSHRGALRGLHLQKSPYGEAKLVRCIRGAIFDVVLDLRQDSKTYKQWESFELNSENHRMLYIPEGLAHGYQSLCDSSEVYYMMSEFYHPESAFGVRWNDPAFGIRWPISEPIISAKDQTYPDFVQ